MTDPSTILEFWNPLVDILSYVKLIHRGFWGSKNVKEPVGMPKVPVPAGGKGAVKFVVRECVAIVC